MLEREINRLRSSLSIPPTATSTMIPCACQPLELSDARLAIDLDILYDPFAEFFLSTFFPLPGLFNTQNTSPCPHGQQLATMGISKSEDTSHNFHLCRFPDTVLIAVRSQPLPLDLAGRLDPTLSLLTEVRPSAREPMRLPVGSLEDFLPESATATRKMSGPSRTRQKSNRASPYPKGKDSIQNIGSRPSNVGHTAQNVTGRRYRRYLIFVLSISRH